MTGFDSNLQFGDETMNKLSKTMNCLPALTLIAATVTVLLTACGGGGGGSPALMPIAASPANEPTAAPPADSLSSEPCSNAADYREGTSLAMEIKPAFEGYTKVLQRESVTLTRESFGDATPVAFDAGTTTDSTTNTANGLTITQTVSQARREFRDIVDGRITLYGERKTTQSHVTVDGIEGSAAPNPSVSTTIVNRAFEPPLSFPVKMQPGEVASQTTERKETFTMEVTGWTGEPLTNTSTSASGQFQLTYHGRERLDTAVGSFDSCKFTYTLQADRSLGASIQDSRDYWVAADGPFRGQVLKETKKGRSYVVSSMSYTPQ